MENNDEDIVKQIKELLGIQTQKIWRNYAPILPKD
jgi:hypothetical protein